MIDGFKSELTDTGTSTYFRLEMETDGSDRGALFHLVRRRSVASVVVTEHGVEFRIKSADVDRRMPRISAEDFHRYRGMLSVAERSLKDILGSDTYFDTGILSQNQVDRLRYAVSVISEINDELFDIIPGEELHRSFVPTSCDGGDADGS